MPSPRSGFCNNWPNTTIYQKITRPGAQCNIPPKKYFRVEPHAKVAKGWIWSSIQTKSSVASKGHTRVMKQLLQKIFGDTTINKKLFLRALCAKPSNTTSHHKVGWAKQCNNPSQNYFWLLGAEGHCAQSCKPRYATTYHKIVFWLLGAKGQACWTKWCNNPPQSYFWPLGANGCNARSFKPSNAKSTTKLFLTAGNRGLSKASQAMQQSNTK